MSESNPAARASVAAHRSRSPRRWIIAAVGVAIVSALVVWRARPERASAASVVRETVVSTLVLTGRVRPPAHPLLGVSIAGTVRTVLVREGDHVRRGQLLLVLDDNQAVAGVAEARAALAGTRATSRSEVERSALELQQAERDHTRARTMYGSGAISLRELEQAAQAAAHAQTAYDAASARMDRSAALTGVAQAQATRDAAQARLALTRITAPAAATVVTRRVESGDAVVPGQVLLALALDGRTQIVAFASEESLAELRLGAEGTVSADAYPGASFAARVSWIAPSIDPAEGTIEVRLDVAEPPSYLLPDMTVSVNVEVARSVNALVVPREAVRDMRADSGWVLVERDGRAVRRDVRLGIAGVNGVEIRDGVTDRDAVLLGNLEPGSRVRIAR